MAAQLNGSMSAFFSTLGELTWLLAGLAVLLMALPFLRYITVGWQLKLDTILDNFDPPSIRLYFRKYRTSEKTPGDKSRPPQHVERGRG